MTPERWREIREVLHEALELGLQERSEYLDCACAADSSLRGEVESLLASSDEARSSFLESLPLAHVSLTEGVETEDAMGGRRLGVYQLVRRIGQGGMGTVFLAVRADGEFRRQVAVKLILPGLNSDDVLKRFRNERQTLASLDHPNIIKLLDGGSTVVLEQEEPVVVVQDPVFWILPQRPLVLSGGLILTFAGSLRLQHQS